jgi:hypothetical protein
LKLVEINSQLHLNNFFLFLKFFSHHFLFYYFLNFLLFLSPIISSLFLLNFISFFILHSFFFFNFLSFLYFRKNIYFPFFLLSVLIKKIKKLKNKKKFFCFNKNLNQIKIELFFFFYKIRKKIKSIFNNLNLFK